MYSKSLLIGLLLVALTATLSPAAVIKTVDCSHQGQQHNYTFGTKGWNDIVLWENELHMKSKLWQISTKDLTYPEVSSFRRAISFIELTDLRKDGTGGCVSVISGGVGYPYVSLHYETLRNHGLDFHIKIYG